MLDIKSYREHLDKLLEENSSNIFLNGGIDYASEFICLLLSNAKKNVNMFCEGLNPEIMGRDKVFSAFKKCIERGVRFNILMEKDTYISEDPYKFASSFENVNIRIIKKEGLDEIDSVLGPGRCNFTVCDDKMVRIEVNPLEYRAVGSFNKPKWADALNKLFNSSFENATPSNKI